MSFPWISLFLAIWCTAWGVWEVQKIMSGAGGIHYVGLAVQVGIGVFSYYQVAQALTS